MPEVASVSSHFTSMADERPPPVDAIESPWSDGQTAAWLHQAGGTVTLVEGMTFCVSAASGDIEPSAPMGLFVLDTRVLSRLRLIVDGESPRGLGSIPTGPVSAAFVASCEPPVGRSERLVVVRRRRLGQGLRETTEIQNTGLAERTVSVQLWVEVDFADVFEVKTRRLVSRSVTPEWKGGRSSYVHPGHQSAVRLDVHPAPTSTVGPVAEWMAEIPAGGTWTLSVHVRPEPQSPLEDPDLLDRWSLREPPAVHHRQWRRTAPTLRSSNEDLDAVFAQSVEDLGTLRVFDPDHPDRWVVAAGAPWYMTLFGRDSLLTAWMTLPYAPNLARGVLDTLADHQGAAFVDDTEEEPGRILHEVRFGGLGASSFSRGRRYYGTADATPLFVMLTAEAARWGLDERVIAQLLPHVDRALEWMRGAGDPDRDGWIEYQRKTPAGLANQGWRDSWDGVRYRDGSVAEAPIALADVQAYAFAALEGRAYLARLMKGEAAAAPFEQAARELKERFTETFWLPDAGWYAVGIDAAKAPIDSLTSSLGHLLWCGIVEDELVDQVAGHLTANDLFTGWGVRTLAASMGGYDPLSYHCGSVWPHDTAIAIAGLARYGRRSEAHLLTRGLIELGGMRDGRLPELIAGFSRADLPLPVDYPSSCAPQAWSAAAPLLALRSMLDLTPSRVDGSVRADGWVPDVGGHLELRGIHAGRQRRVDVVCTAEGAWVGPHR